MPLKRRFMDFPHPSPRRWSKIKVMYVEMESPCRRLAEMAKPEFTTTPIVSMLLGGYSIMRNLENASPEGVTNIQQPANLVAAPFGPRQGLIFHCNGTEAIKCQVTRVETLP